ncbi:MAG: cyclodeaminase/cyclohydrolase family protein [Bacillota bacterium]|jgi:formiminotetrahydrofolate cyclodeaminase
MNLMNFMDDLRAPTGAPGGGAAAAVAGAMGCALFQMVAGVTLSLPRFTEGLDKLEEMREASEYFHKKFLALGDEDANAYRQVEAALKMPRSTSEEKSQRRKAMQEAFIGATESPLNTVEAAIEAMGLLPDLLKYGNPNAITDLAVGFLMLDAAWRGAAMNAEINLGSIKDEEFKAASSSRLKNARKQAAKYIPQLNAAMEQAGLTV